MLMQSYTLIFILRVNVHGPAMIVMGNNLWLDIGIKNNEPQSKLERIKTETKQILATFYANLLVFKFLG